MISHFPIFRKSRILLKLAASLGGSQQPNHSRQFVQRKLPPTNPFANIEIFPRRRSKSLFHYRSAQHSIFKEPSAPDAGRSLDLASSNACEQHAEKDRNELLSEHRSHEHWYLPLQQSPTIITTVKGPRYDRPEGACLVLTTKHFAAICQSVILRKSEIPAFAYDGSKIAMLWGNKCHKQRATHKSRLLVREKALGPTVLARI